MFTFFAFVGPAAAAVTISFYAHKLGNKGFWIEFPHAYVTLNGTTEIGHLPVKANFGFTPPVVGPSVLWGKVDGVVVGAEDSYVAQDTPYFSFPLTDRQYAAVLAVVARWRDAPQPSYDLDTHNCVIFVKEVAAAVGLSVGGDNAYVRRPAEFLADLQTRNAALLARLTTGGRTIATASVPQPASASPGAKQSPALSIISP
ncbi:MAG: hypothetical protein WDM91_01015 [Rhizomicrobium sp.]